MKKTIQRPRGTYDTLDARVKNRVCHLIDTHLMNHGFIPAQTPLFEETNLFCRSLGESSDVISKELYFLRTLHGETEYALRPEATASMMRACIEHRPALPWHTYTIGPMFRHERPQKGRYRQFEQVSVESIGITDELYDAEMIALFDTLFRSWGLTDYALEINYVGTPAERDSYTAALREYLAAHQADLPEHAQKLIHTNILRLFDQKDDATKAIMANAPRVLDLLPPAVQARFERIIQALDTLHISYTINHRLVRGLDYYTGVVFEFTSSHLGAQSAFCGGGRYSNLAQELGYPEPLDCVGAAIGIERFMELLEIHGTLPQPNQQTVSIIPLAPEQEHLALLYGRALRAAGIACVSIFGASSLKSALKRSVRAQARAALLLGEEEQQNNRVTIKDLHTGSQETIIYPELITYIQKLLV